ncbi:hypothetical protein [Pseudidiomarina terrestris]|nr:MULTISPECIES: hypothetical protein [unclassified Pseudidiomarina]
MANDQNFRDPSGPLLGWIAVVLVVAMPLLPAILQWFKHFSA